MNLGDVTRHARRMSTDSTGSNRPVNSSIHFYFLLDNSHDVDAQWRRTFVRIGLAATNNKRETAANAAKGE